MYEMCTGIILLLAMILLYETEVMPIGIFAAESNAEFVMVSVMEVLTICLIPLSLKLFKLNIVRENVFSTKGSGFLIWGSLRMAMICLPMLVNTLMYYMFMNVAFGYMGIIGFICLIFIYPGKKRCISETGGE